MFWKDGDMSKNIDEFLRAFSGAVAVVKMYATTHPQAQAVLKNVFDRLQDVFKDRDELVLGIVEGEIIYDDQILFKLSESLNRLIEYVKNKDIEKIYFLRDIKKEELGQFIAFIISAEEMEQDPQDYLEGLGINGIRVSRLTTAVDDVRKKKEEIGISPYEHALNSFVQFNKRISEKQVVDNQIYSNIKSIAMMIVNKLRYEFPRCLTEECTKKFDFGVIHRLNTAILSAYITSKIGFSQEEMAETCLAALLCLPNRSNRQQDVKDDFIRRYTGACNHAQAMLPFKDVFGVLPVVAAFEQGLPYEDMAMSHEIGFSQKPHPVSMIIALCDIYDYQFLAGKNDAQRTPIVICDSIRKEYAGWFQPKLLDRFINIMKNVK